MCILAWAIEQFSDLCGETIVLDLAFLDLVGLLSMRAVRD